MSIRDLPTLEEQQAEWRSKPRPKPNRFARQALERKAERVSSADRQRLRARIYIADSGRCRRCGRKVYLKLSEAPHELAVGHVHEWIFRSMGGDPLDPLNCILLCSECHPLVQQLKLQIVVLELAKLMRGAVEFIPNGPIVLQLSAAGLRPSL